MQAIQICRDVVQATKGQSLEVSNPRFKAYNQLSIAYWDAGMLDEVLSLLEEVMITHHSSPAMTLFDRTKAITLRSLGQATEAEKNPPRLLRAR